jgi:NADH dehydrogenase
VDVLLLDRNNYHTFFPLLYQVAAAELGPSEIAYPVRGILRGHRNVEFRMAEVTGLDLEGREVVTPLGAVGYDRLILAPGSVSHFFGVEGAAEHAFPLRLMREAIPLRHHILSCFERVPYQDDPEVRRRLLTFAIVGGGPTGVEYAGALAELIHGPLRRDYPGVDPVEVRVLLLEAADRLLGGMPEDLSAYARERLGRRRVEVRTGALVEEVGPREVRLKGGETVATETVVWTAGVQGDPAVREWGLPVARGGRVPVEPTLQVPGHPDVYVVGDLAWLEEGGEPLPQVAPVAIQEGEWAARNVARSVRGQEPEPFHFRDPGMLAVIGRNAAVAQLGERTFTGFSAWILWLVIHIAKLIGFRNRALVLVNWAWNYIFPRRAVRLILPAEGEGLLPPGEE